MEELMKKFSFGLFICLLAAFGIMFTSCQQSVSAVYTPEETSISSNFVNDDTLSPYEYNIAKLSYDFYYYRDGGTYGGGSLNYFTENYMVLKTKDGVNILLDCSKEMFLQNYYLQGIIVFYDDGYVHTHRCEYDDNENILKTYTTLADEREKVFLEIPLPEYSSAVSSIIITMQRHNEAGYYNEYIKLVRE